MTLDELRVRISEIDDQILRLAAERLDAARKVGEIKRESRDMTIVKPDVESKKYMAIKEKARELGLDPEFAASLLYVLMAESVRTQVSN